MRRRRAHFAIASLLCFAVALGLLGVSAQASDPAVVRGAAAGIVLERPPPGPARGLWAVPAAAIYSLAAVALAGSFAHLARRIRRRRP